MAETLNCPSCHCAGLKRIRLCVDLIGLSVYIFRILSQQQMICILSAQHQNRYSLHLSCSDIAQLFWLSCSGRCFQRIEDPLRQTKFCVDTLSKCDLPQRLSLLRESPYVDITYSRVHTTVSRAALLILTPCHLFLRGFTDNQLVGRSPGNSTTQARQVLCENYTQRRRYLNG